MHVDTSFARYTHLCYEYNPLHSRTVSTYICLHACLHVAVCMRESVQEGVREGESKEEGGWRKRERERQKR